MRVWLVNGEGVSGVVRLALDSNDRVGCGCE